MNTAFAAQPRVDQPVVDSAGRITPPWRNYLARLSLTQDSDALRALYETLDKTVTQIKNGQGLQLSILGRQSINADGVVSNGVVVLALVGDEATPAAEAYYGTDATGEKGFHSLGFKLNRQREPSIAVCDAHATDTPAMSLHGGDAGVQAPPALQFHQGDGTHLQARPASGGSKTITLPNASGDLIIDAPSDRQRYVRQDGGWVAIETEPAPASDPLPDAVRARRDLLLKNSNHYMLLDVPLSEAKRTAWMQYRTALRQITSQPGFPSQVTWPAAPHP